jgi:hypothetical protein
VAEWNIFEGNLTNGISGNKARQSIISLYSCVMSLLQQIQLKAVDSKTDPADLLRMCLILSERLDHEPLKNWVESELDGYAQDSKVPRYRQLKSKFIYGDLMGFNCKLSNTLIPLSIIPEQIRSLVTETEMREGIKQLESLLKKGPDAPLCRLWPADALPVVEVHKHFREDFVLTRAWTSIDQGSIVGVIDAVRNKVLKFALEVEKSNPKAGEAQFGSHPVPPEKMTQIFNTTIHGSVTNLATGSDFQQINGSIPDLRNYLKGLGLDTKDVDVLEKAIEKDASVGTGKGPGTNVKKWIGDIAGKAIEGAVPLGLDIIQKAILHYYKL